MLVFWRARECAPGPHGGSDRPSSTFSLVMEPTNEGHRTGSIGQMGSYVAKRGGVCEARRRKCHRIDHAACHSGGSTVERRHMQQMLQGASGQWSLSHRPGSPSVMVMVLLAM